MCAANLSMFSFHTLFLNPLRTITQTQNSTLHASSTHQTVEEDIDQLRKEEMDLFLKNMNKMLQNHFDELSQKYDELLYRNYYPSQATSNDSLPSYENILGASHFVESLTRPLHSPVSLARGESARVFPCVDF